MRIPSRLTLMIGSGVVGLLAFIALGFKVWQWVYPYDELVLYGNVDIRQTDLSFQVGGRIAKMFVDEGDHVKAGQLVAILDPSSFVVQVESAKATLDQAEAQYAKYEKGSRPQEVKSAIAVVEQRKAALENASVVYERQKKQLEMHATSRQYYDTAVSSKQQAEAALKHAEQTLDLLQAGFRSEDIAAAKALRDAAAVKLKNAKLNLQYTRLIAPSNATVMVRVRELGEVVAPRSVIYVLSLDTPVWVRAYVGEPNLGRVKMGMKVLITTDTHPNKPLIGKIGFISPQAEFTPKTVQTKELRRDLVYRMRIVVDDKHSELRQGMPVTVKIPLLR